MTARDLPFASPREWFRLLAQLQLPAARAAGPPGRVAPTSPIGKSARPAVDDPGDMLPETQHERRLGAAWRRLLHDEEGIALVLAILIMLVLTISLTAVMFITAAAARDAHRTNAGQKASALAESGINNALAVLNANYPGTVGYPGDNRLLTTCPA